MAWTHLIAVQTITGQVVRPWGFGERVYISQGTHPTPLRRLGPKERLVRYTPSDRRWRRQGLPESIDLRVIEYQIKGFRPSAVVTHVLDPQVTTREDWVRWTVESDPGRRLDRGLYHRRWEIETTFFELKVSQGEHVLVINAGVGNTNTQHYVEQFKIQHRATKPDLVIMQYFINDSEVIAKKPNGLIYEGSLFLAMLKSKVSALRFGLLGSQSLSDYYKELYEDEAPGWKAVKESVRELRDLTRQKNMRLVILLIPDLHDLSQTSPLVPVYEKILTTFREMGIDTIDILPELTERYRHDVRQAWVAKQDPHPNAEVHGIIASTLTAYLTAGIEGRLVTGLLSNVGQLDDPPSL